MHSHLPKYHEIIQPMLELMKSGQHYSRKTLRKPLQEYFNLSDKDMAITHPKSGSLVFLGRVSWAMTHAKKAEYIESIDKSGEYKITQDGIDALEDAIANNKTVNYKYIVENIPDFDQRFKVKKASDNNQENEDNEDSEVRDLEEELDNDKEVFERAFLERLQSISWQQFEELCIDLLTKMGYGFRKPGTKNKPKVGDGGIDGELFEDKLGLSGSIYIQAKRWKDNKVQPKDIKEFLYNVTSNKGVFITTSDFSAEAKKEVDSNKACRVALINGKQLIKLCKDYEIGCKKQIIERYNIDTDYLSIDDE